MLHNVDVTAAEDPAGIRERLVAQLFSPVRWVETVRAVAASGVSLAIECGPGQVIAGLNKRIDKNLTTLPVFDPESLGKAVEVVSHARG